MNENSSILQETSGDATASWSDRYRESTVLISEKINHAFNQQIGHEFGNSIQYLAIATHFEKESLFGLAKIYYTQADEEREHAMKFVKFVLETGGKVAIPEVPAQKSEFATAESAAGQMATGNTTPVSNRKEVT